MVTDKSYAKWQPWNTFIKFERHLQFKNPFYETKCQKHYLFDLIYIWKQMNKIGEIFVMMKQIYNLWNTITNSKTNKQIKPILRK